MYQTLQVTLDLPLPFPRKDRSSDYLILKTPYSSKVLYLSSTGGLLGSAVRLTRDGPGVSMSPKTIKPFHPSIHLNKLRPSFHAASMSISLNASRGRLPTPKEGAVHLIRCLEAHHSRLADSL